MNLKEIEKPESVARSIIASYGTHGMGTGQIMSNGLSRSMGAVIDTSYYYIKGLRFGRGGAAQP